MSAWKEIFAQENFVEYARASRQICYYLRVLWKEGYDSIVIPSRGSMPIYDAAKSAWIMESRYLKSAKERLDSRMEYINSPVGRELILPFSADPVPNDRTQSSKDIRTFWTKVLGAIVRREGSSPYLKYYKFIVEQLVKDSWHSKIPSFLPTDSFIFVDTVVSGRAICEIFEAFEIEGLNKCHFVLLLDRYGEKIKPCYRSKIDSMVAKGRCTLIPLRRLFTEDRGPAVSGIWSTVYPELMSRVRERYGWASDAYGAGSYYIRVANNLEGFNNAGNNLPVTVINSSIRTLLTTSLRNDWSIDEMVEQGMPNAVIETAQKQNSHLLDYMIHHLVDDVGEYRSFDRATTKKLAAPRVLEKFPKASIDVSSSHLVRVYFPEDILAQQVAVLDAYLDDTSSVFDSWGYFRNP